MTERNKTGGRKAGTPNKATALIRQRIEQADPIGFMIQIAAGKVIDGGKPTIAERSRAAEWLGRKILPDIKELPLSFRVGEIKSSEDALTAIGSVITAMGECLITPSESTAVCGVINQYLKAFELNEISNRLESLENIVSEQRNRV